MITRQVFQDHAPITDLTITAVARLFDDALTGTREPSHSDIEFCIKRANLESGDPRLQGQSVGKAKRIRGTLYWAIENDPESGEVLIAKLISLLRSNGGFRKPSPNYAGCEVIKDAIEAFKADGFELTVDGELRPSLLQNLYGVELTEALKSYVRRAKRGLGDAALVAGTGKDLLEATAAHVITELYGSYSSTSNFPTLLGQAFVGVGMATPQTPEQPGEPPRMRIERDLYTLGCDINRLRNKEGTGHGRPWLPTLTAAEARMAVESMGIIAETLLVALEAKR